MYDPNYHAVLHHIITIVSQYTGLTGIDPKHSFSTLGITSLVAAQITNDLNELTDHKLKAHDLFLYSTPHALSTYLTGLDTPAQNPAKPRSYFAKNKNGSESNSIAIIAMDCKYPDAENCEQLWENCCLGKESITFFQKNQSSESTKNDNSHAVHARGIINNIEYFDASFFNYSPKEAHLSDPQHRLFIESAWIALEKAGYAKDDKSAGRIGVYASMNDSTYILDQDVLHSLQDNLTERFSLQRLMSSQFLATKVGYLFNCTGPCINLQTACSSSLVAVVLACQQLTSLACDIAIAGGVSIITPQDRPYIYQPGNIHAPDGHCHPFDAKAQGTVFSNGLGVVILKRLADALRDHDTIVSVIIGYSTNNDGHDKMSYAGPSMRGQLECIREAHAIAKIPAESIHYVEAHGTGTLIGDPVEIEALTRAFRDTTTKEQFCALGSIKANIGHTHVAAGVAGLIKTSLALQHRQIPPSINFTSPNPNIDFKHSPFYVNTRLLSWPQFQHPRRAAVSAFGVGGTNAHVILEEAPGKIEHTAKRLAYPILLSAKAPKALLNYHDKFIDFLSHQEHVAHPSNFLADLSYTLQVGRNHFPYRSGIVCENLSEAVAKLKFAKEKLALTPTHAVSNTKRIIFLFPGQGAQYLCASQRLYQREPIYREQLDTCLKMASEHMQVPLHSILFPEKNNKTSAQQKLNHTEFTHPILFSIEYALAKLLQHWGIVPDAMLGHSLGEYVAACLAGVFTLKDAIALVCARGKSIALCDEGSMCSVPLSKQELTPFCQEDISIAVEATPNCCVVAGSKAAMQLFQRTIEPTLSSQSLSLQFLPNLHPFHTRLLSPAVEPFLKVLRSIKRLPPQIPYLSNLTGNWVTAEDVANNQYWVDHLLKTVLLSSCIQRILDDVDNIMFIEVGPGRTLLACLQHHNKEIPYQTTLLANAKIAHKENEDKILATALKDIWCSGCEINWRNIYAHETRNRIHLPNYPFQKHYYWFNQILPRMAEKKTETRLTATKPSQKFYVPSWNCDPRRIGVKPSLCSLPTPRRWIIFANMSAVCQQTCEVLINLGEDVIKIYEEENRFASQISDFTINPNNKSHYHNVIAKTVVNDDTHYYLLHFWGVGTVDFQQQENLIDSSILYRGLYSGIFIAQTLSEILPHASVSWMMVTTEVHSVLGNEKVNSLKSCILGLCRVLPLENRNMHLRHIDIDSPSQIDDLILYTHEILNEISASGLGPNGEEPSIATIALRHQKRWRLIYEEIEIREPIQAQHFSPIKQGTYLITGGLGGMGLTLAKWLCDKNCQASIALLARTPFPLQDKWDSWLTDHTSDDAISKKIQKLKQIIHRGGHVEILQGDIADSLEMKKIISTLEARHGTIRGIFHCAGVSGKGIITLKNIHEVQAVLRPKIQGTYVLTQLFEKRPLDFFVSASSLTAIVGGMGQIDYCAANIFLDNFLAQQPLKNCKQSLTINWNSWRTVGMAANVENAPMHCQLYAGNSVTPQEGCMILESLLSNGSYAQVIISRYSPDLEIKRIIQMFQQIQKHIDEPNSDRAVKTEEKSLSVSEMLKYAWQVILGIEIVKENASFYDYGGDSLAMIQLIATIEKHFNLKISLKDLTQHCTFEKMVHFIESLSRNKIATP